MIIIKGLHVLQVQLEKFLSVGLQLRMQGEEIIGLVLQQGGTDVFGLALHFANFDRFVQFVGKDEVDFMLAFPVPKVPDVGVPTAFAGLLSEIAFQHRPRESRVVAQKRLFEQFDAARFNVPHVLMEETEPKCQEIVSNIVSDCLGRSLAEDWTHLSDNAVAVLKFA